jgi:hypothetical protein
MANNGTGIACVADMGILFSDLEAGKERIDGTACPLSMQPSVQPSAQPSVQPYAYASRDPRALRILAKTIYREMRTAGLTEEDLMSVASEMLSLVAVDMKDRRNANETPLAPARVTSRE